MSITALTDLPGCIVSLRADLGVTNDGTGKASAWVDQSGNGNTPTVGSKPTIVANSINGQQVLRFGGGPWVQRTSFVGGAVSQPFTLILVANLIGGGAFQNVIDAGTTTGTTRSALFYGTTNAPFYYSGSSIQASSAVSTGQPHVWIVRFNGASSSGIVIRNGILDITWSGSPGTAGMNGITISGDPSHASLLNGDVAEAALISHSLTSSEETDVRSYMTSRYAITALASPAHATITEAIAFSEAVAGRVLVSPRIAEAIAFAETVADRALVRAVIAEAIAITDLVTARTDTRAIINESISIAEAIAAIVPARAAMSEQIAFAELIASRVVAYQGHKILQTAAPMHYITQKVEPL